MDKLLKGIRNDLLARMATHRESILSGLLTEIEYRAQCARLGELKEAMQVIEDRYRQFYSKEDDDE